MNENPTGCRQSTASLLQSIDVCAAVFDLDGTLIDSMPYWDALARTYLVSQGIAAPDGLEARLKTFTLREAVVWFQSEFGLAGEIDVRVSEILALIDRQYRETIPLKPGVAEYLRWLKDCGLRLAVATATAEDLADACLRRLGVRALFDFILSCETIGIGKGQPNIFLQAAERFGCPPARVVVFEDALYAARTAQNAGFATIGVADASAVAESDALRALCDAWVEDFSIALRDFDGDCGRTGS